MGEEKPGLQGSPDKGIRQDPITDITIQSSLPRLAQPTLVGLNSTFGDLARCAHFTSGIWETKLPAKAIAMSQIL